MYVRKINGKDMADTKEHKTIAGKAGSIELIIEPPLRVISSDTMFVMVSINIL